MTSLSAVAPSYDAAAHVLASASSQPKCGAMAWSPMAGADAGGAASVVAVGGAVGRGKVMPVDAVEVWDERLDAGDEEMTTSRQLQAETALLIVFALIDNALCYYAFYVVFNYRDSLYNVVELQLALLPGLDIALLAFTITGTLCFVAIVVLVECIGFPWFHELMNARLLLSALPNAVILTIMLWLIELTHWIPAVALVSNCFFAFAWCLHMRMRYAEELSCLSKSSLDSAWVLSLLLAVGIAGLSAFSAVDILTKSAEMNCPVAANAKMPVYVTTQKSWHCAKFGESLDIWRKPEPSEQPRLLRCTDPYMAVFGASIEAHDFICPSGCIAFDMATESVTGCGTYAVDSSLCVAAIHAGVLTDRGGKARVYGRIGKPSFESCSRNAVLSARRDVMDVAGDENVLPTAGSGSSEFLASNTGGKRRLDLTPPYVLDITGRRVPQAFHFNNLPDTREFLWLKRYEEVNPTDDGIKSNAPWTRFVGIVSMRIGGVELVDEPVRLGLAEERPLFLRLSGQAAPSSASQDTPSECTVRPSGVLCSGVGHAAVMLDFCRPEAKTCPSR